MQSLVLRSEQWQERARSAIGDRAEVAVLQRLLDEGIPMVHWFIYALQYLKVQ